MKALTRRVWRLFVDSRLLAASAVGTIGLTACARHFFLSAEAAAGLLAVGLVTTLYASMFREFTRL